jgi:hypothetical protein
MMDDVEVLKVGLQYSRRSISCLYRKKGSNHLRAHRIPLVLETAPEVKPLEIAKQLASDHPVFLNSAVISAKQVCGHAHFCVSLSISVCVLTCIS